MVAPTEASHIVDMKVRGEKESTPSALGFEVNLRRLHRRSKLQMHMAEHSILSPKKETAAEEAKRQ